MTENKQTRDSLASGRLYLPYRIYREISRGCTTLIGGKPRWTFTPHLDQNGELAIVTEIDAKTGELKMGTYPAGGK